MIYDREDYQFTADLLRKHGNDDKPELYHAVCSNNMNVILCALDQAAAGPDLLAACRAWTAALDGKSMSVEELAAYSLTHAAIARAEGATP